MNNLVIVCASLCALMVFALLIFSLFAIGFLIGYYFEEKRFSKRKNEKNSFVESEEDKKAKREWKKFISYDGSTTNE